MNTQQLVGTNLGDRHPDFVLPNLDGEAVHLSDYLGKHLLIFMWASW